MRSPELASRKQLRVALLFCMLLFSIGTSGCSSSTKRGVINFFFDDPPQPDSASAPDSVEAIAGQENSLTPVQPAWSFHPASGSTECSTCHDQKQSFRLLSEPETLCSSCHDQRNAPVVHAPVEAGACGECHNPHGTKNPSLLTEVEDKLCFQCHNEEEIKPAAASYLHAPVAAGTCSGCHNPHGTKSARLLIEPGQMLCFQCHGEEEVKSSEIHEEIADTFCHECHAPHSADNKYFIR